MRFQSKLLLVYLLLIVILVSTLSVVYYVGSVNALEKNAHTNLNVLVGKMSQQLDSLIRPMDFISLNLISNGTFMSSMKSLAVLDRSRIENLQFISDAYVEIYRALMNYTISRDYYRVSMFNLTGDFISSISNTMDRNRIMQIIQHIPWTDLVWDNSGRIVVLPPYIDPWNERQEVYVFGVSRTIRGMDQNIGYVEVQAPYKDLENMFYVEKDSMISVLALNKENMVLYSSGIEDEALLDFYMNLAHKGELSPTSMPIPGSSAEQIVTIAFSDYTGIRILLSQSKETLLQPLENIILTTVIAALSVMGVSFIYIFILCYRLTRPLQQLKEEMEQTRFDNLPCEINLPNTNNEIVALNSAFLNLRERLNESIEREIHARNLHLQASFESLQARVNPHFMYNILNVLSHRGLMYGDSVICDICQCIAAMLRYSTSTADLTALLSEELTHVEYYLRLMKKRFEHRLHYTVDVDPDIMDLRIPKIVLQPLVENAINHGFVDIDKSMKIRLTGYKQSNRWFIELHDNGQGFSSPVLKNLNRKMKAASEKNGIAEVGIGIGGMGILNVYSRLALHFQDSGFYFKIKNKPDGGACIILSSLLESKEVSGNENESAPG